MARQCPLRRQSKASSYSLDHLPGEIRNQIFELCMNDAIRASKANDLTISVIPRWQGPGEFRMNGIGPLPLLFVNKKTYNELSSLVYATISEVSIGGYIIQYPDEDPNVRWNVAYSLIKQRPNILAYVKKVKVSLPYVRNDVLDGYWRSLGVPSPGDVPTKCDPWSIVPGLKQFLRKFRAMEILHLVITANRRDPPDFEKLLPLHNYFGRTTVEMVTTTPHNRTLRISTWLPLWENAWTECLLRNGRSKKYHWWPGKMMSWWRGMESCVDFWKELLSINLPASIAPRKRAATDGLLSWDPSSNAHLQDHCNTGFEGKGLRFVASCFQLSWPQIEPKSLQRSGQSDIVT